MGFGYLLAGYVLSFVCVVGFGDYVFAGMLLGGILMLIGLLELRKYCPTFLYSLILCCMIMALSLGMGTAWLLPMLPVGVEMLPSTQLDGAFTVIRAVLYLLFDLSMLYGIADLSKRVDYPETKEKAFRNMIYVVLYNVFQLVTLLPFVSRLENEDRGALMTLLMIVNVLYTVINAFLLFKCYAMICPAGQEDMPRKKSRFAFVNKFREIRDAREEKAIEDMKNYYEEKRRGKNAGKNIVHHSSKKKKKKK